MARGSDGNYFLAALLPGLLLAANATLSRVRGVARTAVLACIPAFALFQAAYAFASAGWATGTRAFDFDLARNWHVRGQCAGRRSVSPAWKRSAAI